MMLLPHDLLITNLYVMTPNLISCFDLTQSPLPWYRVLLLRNLALSLISIALKV